MAYRWKGLTNIEYKGVNNQLLQDIEWVEVVNKNQDSP